MDIERLRLYLLSKRGSTEDMPFGEDCLTFRVEGKIFACLDLSRPDRVVLKSSPERTAYLTSRYAGVIGAWHWNKRHWIEVLFGSDVADALLLRLADDAYTTVLHALPKKRQIAFLTEGLPTQVYFSHTNTCTSTNDLAWQVGEEQCIRGHYLLGVVHSDLQRNGRGQQGTRWESENAKNLTFSLVVSPTLLPPLRQFVLLQLTASVIVKTIAQLLPDEAHLFSIKWPNDIYYRDRKLCGTLIQHAVSHGKLRLSVIGVGLNVNQTSFSRDVPNPVSLAEIRGGEVNRFTLLEQIIQEFVEQYSRLAAALTDNPLPLFEELQTQYRARLYRSQGMYRWADKGGDFEAQIDDVLPDGTIRLLLPNGERRTYQFKQLTYK